MVAIGALIPLSRKQEPSGPLGRAGVRRLLQSLIRTDEDLEALCLDYFTSVHSRFARGMDRLGKVNLLIELTEPAKVVAGLRERFSKDPSALATIDHCLAGPHTEEEREARAQWDKIEQLYIQREQLLRQGQSTADVDKELVTIKRAQRADPLINEGALLRDRYRLINCIGRGGFAKVWSSFDRMDRRTVAVKILRGEHNAEPVRRERFIRGARHMKELSHSNIVRVLDGPEESDGFLYFVMDYLHGGDLYHAVLDRKIDLTVSLRAILDVGSALAHVHQRGLIHRDVKPQNILLNEQGTAYLTDFDLVWAADTTGGTQTGFLGTHLYVAPEQAEEAKSVDHRVDIYSLGMTALFVLHGTTLPQKAVYQRALFIDELPCPENLKSLLRQATAIDPADRPANVLEFCRQFTELLPMQYRIEHDVPRQLIGAAPAPAGHRRGMVSGLIACATLLFASFGGIVWRMTHHAPSPIPQTSVSAEVNAQLGVVQLDMGQSQLAAIQGVVTAQETGKPVSFVTVIVTGPALHEFKTATSDAAGRYIITQLPPGSDYEVRVHFGADDRPRFVRPSIRLSLGKTVTVNAPIETKLPDWDVR